MKNIAVNHLVGLRLDWAVAKAMGLEVALSPCYRFYGKPKQELCGYIIYKAFSEQGELSPLAFNPSSDWAIGGPIIEKTDLSIYWSTDQVWWVVSGWDEQGKQEITHRHSSLLVASMRCIVECTLGPIVSLPSELQ